MSFIPRAAESGQHCNVDAEPPTRIIAITSCTYKYTEPRSLNTLNGAAYTPRQLPYIHV